MHSLSMNFKGDLVAISYLVSVQAAYSALLILQMRFARWLLLIAALCLSVSGIWAMHFTGMAAMMMDTDVSYNVGWTIGSVFFAYVPTLLAFLLLDEKCKGDTRDTRDISVEAHMDAMRNAPHGTIGVCATLIALGVCVMHYTGMQAMQPANAHQVIEWGVVIASVLIAMFAATAALYFAFVLPSTREYTVPTALVAGVAVCGMHYCGMYGIRYEMDDPSLAHPGGSSSLSPYVLYIVFASSFLSSSSLAFTSYMHRLNLRQAGDDAQVFANKILAGRFDDLHQDNGGITVDDDRQDVTMRGIKNSYILMGDQLKLLRGFLPPSLLAQFEAARNPEKADADGADDNDDEGDIASLSRSCKRSVDNSSSHRSGKSAPSSPATGGGRASTVGIVSRFDAGIQWRHVGVLCLNTRGFHDVHNDGEFVSRYAEFASTLRAASKQHKGVLDVMHGDRVLMSFNASVKNANYAASAALAALTISTGLSKCASIGIATGKARCGNLGDKDMMRYCVCGPVVSNADLLMRRCYDLHDTQGTHILTLSTPEMEFAVQLRAVEAGFAICRDVAASDTNGSSSHAAVVYEVMHALRVREDEWMYEIQMRSQSSRFGEVNAAFEMLAQKDARGALAQATTVVVSPRTTETVPPDGKDEQGSSLRGCTKCLSLDQKLSLSVQKLISDCGSALNSTAVAT